MLFKLTVTVAGQLLGWQRYKKIGNLQ